jgi:hypothetical protein
LHPITPPFLRRLLKTPCHGTRSKYKRLSFSEKQALRWPKSGI